MTKIGKKLAAVLLAVAMVITFMPALGTQTVYASSGDPAMSLGTEVLDQDVNTSGAQTVWYADKAWRVIGYDGNGAASGNGAATLLAAGNLDQSAFDEISPFSNVYADSTLKTKVDTIAGTLTEGEKGAVKARTLAHGDYNQDEPWNTDCVAGDADLAAVLLWPLSTKEANAVNSDLRVADPEHTNWATSYWRLRSPGVSDHYTAFVDGHGSVGHTGYYVSETYGVRPAFDLNLESVLFISAAESGKSSGAEGADALKVQSDQTNSGDEWKVTVKDSAHSGFAVSNVTGTENGMSVTYTGALTGTNEYISAIITDKPITDSSAKITYYGRLKNCTSASDTVTINTAGKLGTGDTLYVFNEQYNGDKKTDYASALQEVKIPITAIDISNLILPQEGESPDTTSFTTNAEAAGYTVDKVFWLDRSASVNGEVLQAGDTFKAGTNYGFCIKAIPASGYIFPEDKYDVTVTVNGKSYACDDYSKDIGTALWWCGNEREWLWLRVFYKVPEQIAVPSGKSLTYNGKSQTGVAEVMNYTLSGNTATKAGSYTATASLKYPEFDTWADGTTADKTIKWTIAPKKITPAVTFSATSYTWNGKIKKATVTVKDGSTKLAASDYTVTYKNNKNVGKASAVVTLKGNYSGSKTVTFKINPKGTTLKAPAAVRKAATIRWKKQASKMSTSRITGYQIQLATNSKFTKNKKTVTVKGYSKTSKKVTKLKGGKKYYVKIRTYKTVGGIKYYSPWSKVKTVTTKK